VTQLPDQDRPSRVDVEIEKIRRELRDKRELAAQRAQAQLDLLAREQATRGTPLTARRAFRRVIGSFVFAVLTGAAAKMLDDTGEREFQGVTWLLYALCFVGGASAAFHFIWATIRNATKPEFDHAIEAEIERRVHGQR
jgi:hypothetical protein